MQALSKYILISQKYPKSQSLNFSKATPQNDGPSIFFSFSLFSSMKH